MISFLKKYIYESPKLKKWFYYLMMHPIKGRPRLWLRSLSFLYIKKGKNSYIYRNIRNDITPFNKFVLGEGSIIESYCVINNAVGDLIIGDGSRMGIGGVLLGPVTMGNNVQIGQNVVISALDHNYQNVTLPLLEQGITISEVKIADYVYIGANSVINRGVKIGTRSFIASGSVVTKDVPDYTVVGGVPAKVLKRYDMDQKEWIKA